MNAIRNTSFRVTMSKRPTIELFAITVFSIAIYVISTHVDMLERILEFTTTHEDWELDEIITVSIFWVLAFLYFSFQRWAEAKRLNIKLVERNIDLEKALTEVAELKGIIPICASCKKIRDDKGYWHQVESYISSHSKADFSHGICPDCMKRLYPEFKKDPFDAEAK